MGSVVDIDTWLLLAVNGEHTDLLDPIMKMFSGRFIWVFLYVAIAALIWWRFGWRRAILLIIAAGIAVGATDYLCASVIRPLVQRMRPTNPDNEISALVHIVDGYRSGQYGFPSCHAANTFALAVFTSLVLKMRLYTVFIYLWALAQCYSRLYLGVHYPGDLLVGAIIGSAIAYGMYFLCSRLIDIKYELNKKARPWPVVTVGLCLCVIIVVINLLK